MSDESAHELIRIFAELMRKESPDADELFSELERVLSNRGSIKPLRKSSTVHSGWWGNYHEIAEPEYKDPLHLVFPHQDPLDVTVSSLRFPNDMANMELDPTTRKGLLIDEVTMADLRLNELAGAINQTKTQAGYRMLEYLLNFPLRDPKEIRYRQEMFKELADNPQMIDGLTTYFGIMSANEHGFVEFTYPTKSSSPPSLHTFNNARKYLAAIPAIVAQLRNARSRKLVEIRKNMEKVLATGEMQDLYRTVINQEVMDVVRLDPSTWTDSINDTIAKYLLTLAPIMSSLEHGRLTVDFRDGAFRLTPRPADEPIMLNIPIHGLRVDLDKMRPKYFDRNLIFNLYYSAGLVEALCTIGNLPRQLYPTPLTFPSFTNDKEYAARLTEPTDPFLLLGGVDVVKNPYEIDGETRGYVVSGPNSGGKTVFAFTLPKLQALAQVGAPIPAGMAQIAVADHVYTLRPTVYEGIGEGRYIHSLRRGRYIMENATSRSLVSIDDFEGTDPDDSYRQALVILENLYRTGAGITMSTQDIRVPQGIYEDGNLSKGIIPMHVEWEELPDGIKFLYRAVPGIGKSIGGAAAKTAFMDRDSLNQLMQRRGYA